MANGDTAAATSCKPRAQKTNSNGSNSIRFNNARFEELAAANCLGLCKWRILASTVDMLERHRGELVFDKHSKEVQ